MVVEEKCLEFLEILKDDINMVLSTSFIAYAKGGKIYFEYQFNLVDKVLYISYDNVWTVFKDECGFTIYSQMEVIFEEMILKVFGIELTCKCSFLTA